MVWGRMGATPVFLLDVVSPPFRMELIWFRAGYSGGGALPWNLQKAALNAL
jgi:hypothetical protein